MQLSLIQVVSFSHESLVSGYLSGYDIFEIDHIPVLPPRHPVKRLARFLGSLRINKDLPLPFSLTQVVPADKSMQRLTTLLNMTSVP